MSKLDAVRKVAIVDDDSYTRADFAQVCTERKIKCVKYASRENATKNLPKQAVQIVFVDGSLHFPSGEDAEGVELAEDLCKSKHMKGVALYVYTKFLSPVAQYAPVREAIPSLLERFRARNRADLNTERRVINRDLDDCMRDLCEEALLKRGLDNLAKLK